MSDNIINESINGLIEVSMFKTTLRYHAICMQDLNMIISKILHKIIQDISWYAGNQPIWTQWRNWLKKQVLNSIFQEKVKDHSLSLFKLGYLINNQ